MKLPLRQLDRHLSDGLAKAYLVAGDETLLIDEALERGNEPLPEWALVVGTERQRHDLEPCAIVPFDPWDTDEDRWDFEFGKYTAGEGAENGPATHGHHEGGVQL